jgi:hypothetical protein
MPEREQAEAPGDEVGASWEEMALSSKAGDCIASRDGNSGLVTITVEHLNGFQSRETRPVPMSEAGFLSAESVLITAANE